MVLHVSVRFSEKLKNLEFSKKLKFRPKFFWTQKIQIEIRMFLLLFGALAGLKVTLRPGRLTCFKRTKLVKMINESEHF